MYFTMLKATFRPNASYRIYLDIKDTRSAPKVKKLWDVLCNNAYDFSREIIQKMQTVRSHEVEQLQLADLLIGAIAYINRDLSGSSAKQRLVETIREHSGYSLTHSTLYREDKLNLLQWTAQEADA
jgi:predicted membrane chloride channel (bestrophin family)